jgi:hypothetical protein
MGTDTEQQAEPISLLLTDEQRRTVRAMAGFGAPRKAIAAYLKIDVARLNTLLGDELDQAEADANTKVAQALFTMATRQNNVAAAIFWMKARGAWREKHEVDARVTTEQRHYVLVAPPMIEDPAEWAATYAPKGPR